MEKPSTGFTPVQPPISINLSPSHLRVLAFLADLAYIFIFGRFVIYPFLQPQDWDLAKPALWSNTNSLWAFVLFLLVISKDSFGASLGKWIFNLHIAKVEEGWPGIKFWQTWQRNLCLVFFPYEVYALVAEKYGRRLGDRWVGSCVMKGQRPFVVRSLTNRCLAVLLFFALVWVGYNASQPWQISQSSLYRKAVEKFQTRSATAKKIAYYKELYWEKGHLMLVFHSLEPQEKVTSEFDWASGTMELVDQKIEAVE